jgi:hypothetical protein
MEATAFLGVIAQDLNVFYFELLAVDGFFVELIVEHIKILGNYA